MDAATISRRAPALTPLAQLARTAVLTATGVLLGLGVLLFVRRAAGGSLQALNGPALVLLGCFLSVSGALIRAVWGRMDAQPIRSKLGRLVWISVSASVLLLALSVSLPGSSTAALVALWLTIVAEEAAVWGWLWRRGRRRTNEPLQSGAVEEGAGGRVRRLEHVESKPDAPEKDIDRPLPHDATQSLIRQTDAQGVDVLTGQFRGQFRAGERTVFVHVAFCPPFARLPEVTCEQIAGPPVDIKVAQLQTYGVRLDVKLKRPSDEPAAVNVRLEARSAIESGADMAGSSNNP